MRKVLTIVLVLLCACQVQADDRTDPTMNMNLVGPDAGQQTAAFSPSSRAMWDLMFSFETPSSSQSGVASDGQYIYSSSFSTEIFRKFEMDGTLVEEFSIPGVPTCNCLTFDGQYFYGAMGNLVDGILVLDLENQTLINTISLNVPSIIAVGHISYDPKLAEGLGGFWVGYWYEMAAIGMDGNEIVANVGSPEAISGTAFDDITDPDNPCLYTFMRSGNSQREFYRFDINTRTYSGVIHDAVEIPGDSSNPLSAGCDPYVDRDGILALVGMIDHFPENEVIFGYEIARAFVYANDLSVQALLKPESGENLTANEVVQVRVKNNGTEVISSVDLQYTVNNLGPFTAHVATSLDPGEVMDITFDEQADLSQAGSVYHFIVTNLNADENAANDVWVKDVENTAGVYCWASASGGSEYISIVAISGISNSTGDDHYSDYTNDSNLLIQLEPEVPTQLVVSNGHGYNANILVVWVDWNGDGDFYDDGAAYTSSFGPGPYITYLIPPEYALIGVETRMRIRLDYNNPTPDPCGSTSFGEVEDYAIVIAGTVGIDDGTLPDDSQVQGSIPSVPSLSGNHPNPFNPSTEIHFVTVSDQIHTTLQVFDLNGRIVRSLISEVLPAGEHTVTWNGRNGQGDLVASGIYFYRLENEEFMATRKMTLLK